MNLSQARPSFQKDLLNKYVDAVIHAPRSLCLTAARNTADFWERHVLDALKLIEQVPSELQDQNLKVLDVGSGNGIPGIPAAIAIPNWQLFLLESNNRKSGFIDMFCKFNHISNVHVVSGRSEILAHYPAYRAQFDLVLARALAKLPTALELCVPFLKNGGLLIIPHGSTYPQELAQCKKALHDLATGLLYAKPYQVSKELNFTALFFKKENETPERYPRKPGFPKKNPL